jgi:hypothetical protein
MISGGAELDWRTVEWGGGGVVLTRSYPLDDTETTLADWKRLAWRIEEKDHNVPGGAIVTTWGLALVSCGILQ